MNYSSLKTGIFFLFFVSFSFSGWAQLSPYDLAAQGEIEIDVEETYEEIYDELMGLLAENDTDTEEADLELDPTIDAQALGRRRRQNRIRNRNLNRNLNRNQQLATCQKCDTSIEMLKTQFGGFILFELLVIPSLVDNRVNRPQIQQLANRFVDNFADSIHRYNPALNVQQFRRSARNLTQTTISALQRGNLNRSPIRRNLNRNFTQLTQFWQQFVFPNFPAGNIAANFDRALTLLERIRNKSVNNRQLGLLAPFQLYHTLLTSIVEIIDQD